MSDISVEAVTAVQDALELVYSEANLIQWTNQDNPTATEIDADSFYMLAKLSIAEAEIYMLRDFLEDADQYIYLACMIFGKLARVFAFDIEQAARVEALYRSAVEQLVKTKQRFQTDGNHIRESVESEVSKIRKTKAAPKTVSEAKGIDI